MVNDKPLPFDPRLPAAFLQAWLEQGRRLRFCTDPVIAWLNAHGVDVRRALAQLNADVPGLWRACGVLDGMQVVADVLGLQKTRHPEAGDVVCFRTASGDVMAGLQLANLHVGAISSDGRFVTAVAPVARGWSLRRSRAACLKAMDLAAG